MIGARDRRGFTLVELLIALSIVGALLAIAFGGLNVAIKAWRQGEDRAEAHQHVRSIALILARAVSATHPYRASRGEGPDPVVLFAGTDKRIEFVTQAVPFPGPTPIAFTAVVFELDDGGERRSRHSSAGAAQPRAVLEGRGRLPRRQRHDAQVRIPRRGSVARQLGRRGDEDHAARGEGHGRRAAQRPRPRSCRPSRSRSGRRCPSDRDAARGAGLRADRRAAGAGLRGGDRRGVRLLDAARGQRRAGLQGDADRHPPGRGRDRAGDARAGGRVLLRRPGRREGSRERSRRARWSSTRAARAPIKRLPHQNVPLGGGQFTYCITDEEGRINLNYQTDGRSLQQAAGGHGGRAEPTGTTISDSLLDWKDANEEHRLNGAESEDTYLKLPVPYRSKNGNLESVSELVQVKGVTPALLEGVEGRRGLADRRDASGARRPAQRQHRGPRGPPGPWTVRCRVLRASSSAGARSHCFVAARPARRTRRQPWRITSRTFRIEALGLVDGQVRARVTAIVRKGANTGTDGTHGARVVGSALRVEDFLSEFRGLTV